MRPKKKRSRAETAPESQRMSAALPEAQRKPLRRYLIAGTALCLLTLLAFSNSFATGFALDNQVLLLGDPRIQQASASNIDLILGHTYWWPNGEAGLYRPLTTLSYLLNYAVLGNGNRSAGYHWVNFFLHTANVLLVFTLTLRLLARRAYAFRTALFIAALWAVHPVLTESVTNIVGRADLLGALAVLSGFLMYLKSTETTGWRQILWLGGLALATAVGVFSKESAVVLPGVIILYEAALGVNAWEKAMWGCLATLVPIAALLWQRAAILTASPPAEWPFVDNPIAGATFWIGRLTAIKVLARYLLLALWPVKLSSDYSYSEITLSRGGLEDWIAWIVMGAALALLAVLWTRNRLAFFFGCFGFLNLLPASNLLFPIGTIMAERLMYLPLLGIVACLIIAIPRALPMVLVCSIVAAFSVRTWIRNLDWTNDLTMGVATVQTSPHSFKTHRLLAAALFQADPNHAHIDRAITEADKGLAILSTLPDNLDVPNAWNQAAALHLAKGDILPQGGGRGQYEEAVRIALRSIAIDTASRAAYARSHQIEGVVPSGAADGYRILASAYLRLSQAGDALPAAMQARMIDPGSVEVYGEIADAYLAEHRGEDAAIALAQGMFATGDHSLRADLLKLYQSGVDTKGCAVVAGPRGPALNPSCEMVHRDLCEGTARANRQDLRQQLACPE